MNTTNTRQTGMKGQKPMNTQTRHRLVVRRFLPELARRDFLAIWASLVLRTLFAVAVTAFAAFLALNGVTAALASYELSPLLRLALMSGAGVVLGLPAVYFICFWPLRSTLQASFEHFRIRFEARLPAYEEAKLRAEARVEFEKFDLAAARARIDEDLELQNRQRRQKADEASTPRDEARRMPSLGASPEDEARTEPQAADTGRAGAPAFVPISLSPEVSFEPVSPEEFSLWPGEMREAVSALRRFPSEYGSADAESMGSGKVVHLITQRI